MLRDPGEFSDRLPLIQLRVARKHVAFFLSIAKPERGVEVGIPLPSLRWAFGLEPFEVRQVAQRGEAERLQEFPRRDISKRRARAEGRGWRRRSGRGA